MFFSEIDTVSSTKYRKMVCVALQELAVILVGPDVSGDNWLKLRCYQDGQLLLT